MLVVFKKNTDEKIFVAIKKFYRNKLSASTLSLTRAQLSNIYQATDVEESNSIKELHNHFHTGVGVNRNIKITIKKLNYAVLLLLAYDKKMITFK